MADTTVHWLNLVLAALAGLVAFGSFNKMQSGKTRPCLIWGMLLVAVGLGGQWLGLWFEDWLKVADTALYGGILAVLLASQRTHSWVLERFANPIASIACWIAGGVLLIGLLSGCATVQEAQPTKPAAEIPVHVVEQDGLSLRLMARPCVDPRSGLILAGAFPQHLERAKASESTWRMRDASYRDFVGCWLELSAEESGAPESVLILTFEDGEAFAVPKAEFLKTKGGSGV